MQIFDPSITGSLNVTGSTTHVGDLTVSGTIFTSNIIEGTASWAENALTASYALNAVGGASVIIADEGNTQGSATLLDFTGAGVSVTVSSNTASINIPGGGGGSTFPYTGSAIISGSLTVTGSSYLPNITGSLFGTSSWAENVITSSYSLTSSYTVDQGTYYPGIISGSAGWSQTGTGQINLPNVTVALYDNPSFYAPLKLYSVTGGTTGVGGIPALTNNSTNFIYVDYNGGNPIYNVTLNFNDVTNSDSVMLLIVYRLNNFVHVLEFGDYGAGLAMKSAERTVRTDRFARESGLDLSLNSTTGVATVAAGVAWNGPYRQQIAEVNSQDDIFFKNYHSASVWTYSTAFDFINNSVYDNGVTTASVDPGKYLVNWYYRGQEVNDHIYEIISPDQYDTIADANISLEPQLPELVASHAFLVGRIIVPSGSYNGIVQSAFDKIFPTVGISSHNDLADIQGGTSGQYYHLTQTQYNNIALQNTAAQSLTGSFLGNLFGTSSWAENVISSSYSLTSSFAVTASYVQNVISASYAITASYVQNVESSSYAATASYVANAISASYATTASYVQNSISASYATTASYINGMIVKNNAVAAGSFTGNPRKATVTFTTPFPNANYSITITGEDSRTWTIESKVSGSFIINSNSAIAPINNTYWQAISYGEFQS